MEITGNGSSTFWYGMAGGGGGGGGGSGHPFGQSQCGPNDPLGSLQQYLAMRQAMAQNAQQPTPPEPDKRLLLLEDESCD